MTEELALKWGTLKYWDLNSKINLDLMQEYIDIGASMSAMLQEDTPRQKEIICEIINNLDCDYVYNDWSGEKMTKDQAKHYVMTYGD